MGNHAGAAVPGRRRRGADTPLAAAKVEPERTEQTVEDEIVELREELDRGGHEACAATIAAHLQQRHGPDAVPAVSTIWRILSAAAS